MTDKNYEINYWDIEDHTKVKHKTVGDYINIWIKILGKFNDLTIFDCYGGNGIYKDENNIEHDGSPIIILKSIKDNNLKLNRNTKLIIIEKDPTILHNLEKVIIQNNLMDFCELINNDFNAVALSLINNKTTSANLFFIDPFGYSIDFSILKEIMTKSRTEIILNFMFNGINRGISSGKVDSTLDILFNTKQWRKCIELSGSEREEQLVSLYRNKCKEIASFVYPYRISFPDQNRTYYYLFHLTNHYKGASIMKSSFAKYNFGNIEYIGKMKNQTTIFDLLKKRECADFLYNKYWNSRRTYERIIEECIDESPFLESEIRNSLKKLEKEGKIIVQRIDSLKTGLKGNDLITF